MLCLCSKWSICKVRPSPKHVLLRRRCAPGAKCSAPRHLVWPDRGVDGGRWGSEDLHAYVVLLRRLQQGAECHHWLTWNAILDWLECECHCIGHQVYRQLWQAAATSTSRRGRSVRRLPAGVFDGRVSINAPSSLADLGLFLRCRRRCTTMQLAWGWAKMMNFVLKTRNFVLRTRNCVSKTRNCVLKTSNFVLKWCILKVGHDSILRVTQVSFQHSRILISYFEESWFPIETCWFLNIKNTVDGRVGEEWVWGTRREYAAAQPRLRGVYERSAVPEQRDCTCGHGVLLRPAGGCDFNGRIRIFH